MNDLISRQAAIDALHTWFSDGFDEDRWWNSTHVLAAIEGIPSAQPTLYGYKIEHLAMIARMMEKEGVSPEKAAEFFADIAAAVKMIVNEQKEIIKMAVEQWMI